MAKIWMPLPDRDFDVSESAVPWKILTDAGHEVVFATEGGDAAPSGDRLLLEREMFGTLGAQDEPRRFYLEMEQTEAFKTPVRWADFIADRFDGVVLPGGHAPGMKQYLASEDLQRKLAEFWQLDRPVGAICHGVVVLSRAVDPETGKSLLTGRKTTGLPKYMEQLGFALSYFKHGRRYRTYPEYVQDEVNAAISAGGTQFVRGPITLGTHGTADDDGHAFVVEDGNYVSARWPGDAYLFARKFLALIEAR